MDADADPDRSPDVELSTILLMFVAVAAATTAGVFFAVVRVLL